MDEWPMSPLVDGVVVRGGWMLSLADALDDGGVTLKIWNIHDGEGVELCLYSMMDGLRMIAASSRDQGVKNVIR